MCWKMPEWLPFRDIKEGGAVQPLFSELKDACTQSSVVIIDVPEEEDVYVRHIGESTKRRARSGGCDSSNVSEV